MEFIETQAIFFVTFVGLMFVAAGVVLLLRRKSKLAHLTMPVVALVTDVIKEERTEWKEHGDGIRRSQTRVVYRPILEYEVGGRVYKKPHSPSELAGRVSEGDTIEVLCNPDNPSEACCRSDAGGLGLPIAAIVAGGAVVLAGILKLIE
jgi:hypothetical protein